MLPYQSRPAIWLALRRSRSLPESCNAKLVVGGLPCMAWFFPFAAHVVAARCGFVLGSLAKAAKVRSENLRHSALRQRSSLSRISFGAALVTRACQQLELPLHSARSSVDDATSVQHGRPSLQSPPSPPWPPPAQPTPLLLRVIVLGLGVRLSLQVLKPRRLRVQTRS